ncbi:hypothetical protein CK203_085773 [Vitis vinifera]|uniref:Uncharacterized protein n=1 Tax=Vitis vinifera TaxID=29760 RepID=A0A438E339_VITVI|nr:hypothetical protein CK203_085773 [Vitis vinifera]
MGLKRSFENEEFQELPFKNMKCVESRDKLASFGEIVPCKDAPQKPDISDECSFYKFQCGTEGVENGVSVLDDKGLRSALLVVQWFKQVPVGPDHQANVPVWSLQKVKNRLDKLETSNRYISSSQSMVSDQTVDGENEERWMGTCVIPMPEENLSAENGVKTGDGRTDCGCLDNDSIRCVRQHVMEAREKLRKTLGQEKFMELGFCDMGEEVALKWHEEEEQAFHEEPHEEDDDDDDDDDDDEEDDDKDDSDFDGDGGFGDDKQGATKEDGMVHNGKLLDYNMFDPVARNMDKVPDSNGEDFSVQDDSCMSFECQPNVATLVLLLIRRLLFKKVELGLPSKNPFMVTMMGPAPG